MGRESGDGDIGEWGESGVGTERDAKAALHGLHQTGN